MHSDPLEWWRSEVAEIAPVGHVLRQALRNNWTRFHSLPESKRYAEAESEYREIFVRHGEVADEIFCAGEPIYVYRSHLHEKKLRGKQKHQVANRQLRESMVKLPANPGAVAEDEDDQYYVRALVSQWRPDFFESLVRQVSDWQQTGVALVSPATKNIYCPYDGGMDIFSFSVGPAALEAKFLGWQSNRPDKL